MQRTSSSSYQLDFTGLEHETIICRALMSLTTCEKIGKNFHVSMRVDWEAATADDVVVIDNTK